MRKVDWRFVHDLDPLVLLTAEDVIPGLDMAMADFRDMQGLYYDALEGWLGLCRAGVMVGHGVPFLVNGVWYVRLDSTKRHQHPDHKPDVSRMRVRRIA